MANPLLSAAKPQPMPASPFKVSDIYASLGLPMNGEDAAYWGGRQQQGVSQQNVQSSLPAVNAAFQQLLGRDMQAGVMPHLDPALQAGGPQAVRQRLMRSEEYQNRMLGPSASPWQTAARQATSNQSMMPGTFGDYTNPLFADPASAQQLMAPTNPISQAIFGALNDPESEFVKGILGDLLKKPEDTKKKSTGKGRPQGGRFAPNPEGATFLERTRGF